MSFSHDIAAYLPFLRRYARALTGSQAHGDAYVRATLEAILQAPAFVAGMPPRVALYRVFHVLWSRTYAAQDGVSRKHSPHRDHFVGRIGAMSLTRREALLLTAMENFSAAETAMILGLEDDSISGIVKDAIADLVAPIPASVLIIEDEPIISMDLVKIVEDMGHSVAAVAATQRQALAAAAGAMPDLVLADIQLADGGSGIETVNNIMINTHHTTPVVFITAHSELLLTGERPEPVFLVTKPFATRSVKAAIGQALLLAEDPPAIPAAAEPHRLQPHS